MAATIIKGNDLMLFDNQGKSIAYATAHTLSLSGETSDTSSKDHGIWGAQEVTRVTWEITTENLYTEDAFDTLMAAMLARTAIDVEFGLKAETGTGTVVDGDYPNWTPKTGSTYKGKAFITSLTANANNGENATFSATFSGAGKLEK